MNLSHRKPHAHVSDRSSACRKVFHALQGAGLCNLKTNADTAPYVWKTAIRPTLTYRLDTAKVDKKGKNELESMQKL